MHLGTETQQNRGVQQAGVVTNLQVQVGKLRLGKRHHIIIQIYKRGKYSVTVGKVDFFFQNVTQIFKYRQ